MRLLWVGCVLVLAAGCGSDATPPFGGGGTGGSGTTSTTTTSSGTVCTPNEQDTCPCPDGGYGTQYCAEDGSGWSECDGCGGEGGSGGTSSSGGGGGAGGGTGGAGGSQAQCMTPADCPGVDTDCQARSCTGGVCGFDYQPAGTPVQQQTAGDCATVVCDGAGGTTPTPDPLDIEDDNNQCTADSCAPVPVHDPMPTGTPCMMGGNLCQAGTCVAYIPVVCMVGNTPYQACDGFAHPGLAIVWSGPNGGVCNGVPTDVGYCPPGEPCGVTLGGGPTMFGVCQ